MTFCFCDLCFVFDCSFLGFFGCVCVCRGGGGGVGGLPYVPTVYQI